MLELLITLALASNGSPVGAPPSPVAFFSDHGDTPLLASLGRQDANISDLYVFRRGANLVLIVCTNVAIPIGLATYTFPSDLEIEIHIDNDSEVDFSDPATNTIYGGRVVNPHQINADTRFRVRFPAGQEPRVQRSGGPRSEIQLFAGLRDDPFIRGPRQGRNVAAIVIEVPLDSVTDGSSTLLVWATSNVTTINGAQEDHAGRALRSMFVENHALNFDKPKHHQSQLGLVPDVVIYNLSAPAVYPNGRELADDVVDLVGDPRVLMNDAPFPSTNDRPFSTAFPYLATPHR